jgi:Family of unknown function (DUF6262)
MSSTAAAIEARREASAKMLQRIDQAVRQMRREGARITVAGVARRADVSRTFLYQNDKARALISAASDDRSHLGQAERADPSAPGWRDRALNAEHELKRARDEITMQRTRIGELLGYIRDLQHDLPDDGVQRILTENHSLKVQLRQAAADQRLLQEALAGARDNNRFLDKRVAQLEARLVTDLADPAHAPA